MLHSLHIRKATPADLDALVENILAMAQESEGRLLDRRTLSAGVAAVFEKPERGVYWVAQGETGQLAANTLITEEWSDWNNAPYWWIQSLYIRPEFRGQGLFARLVSHLELEAVQAGASEIRLYVENHNERAIRAYLKTGFSESHYEMMVKPVESRQPLEA